MHRREFLSQLAGGGGAACMLGFSGCGTMFYSERVGQPHSRDIDWQVAGLNALGLLLFFVPGVVAFAVDFYTGAIYLPPECPPHVPGGAPHPYPTPQPTVAPELADQPSTPSSTQLQRVPIPRGELSRRRIEKVIGDRIGQQICLLKGNARASELQDVNCFAQQRRRHIQDPRFGTTARAFFAQPPPV